MEYVPSMETVKGFVPGIDTVKSYANPLNYVGDGFGNALKGKANSLAVGTGLKWGFDKVKGWTVGKGGRRRRTRRR